MEHALAIETFDPDTTRTAATFLHDRSPNPDSLLRAGAIQLVVEGMTGDEYRRVRVLELATFTETDSAETGELADLPDVPVIRLHYRSDRDVSRAAVERLRQRLESGTTAAS